jgi:hypothetical protein
MYLDLIKIETGAAESPNLLQVALSVGVKAVKHKTARNLGKKNDRRV